MPGISLVPSAESVARARTAVQALYARDRASQALGLELLEIAPGRVQVAMPVREDMLNGYGLCHGGVLFALADSAFAFACNSYGEAMVAAGASIEFLAPTPGGVRLIATASEIWRNERRGIYDVSVTNTAAEALAHFRGHCARLRVAAPTK
ncbi:MAG TPA: hydroxyphenylacetyl-CoA thioesterase PaaI [Steroidobacteraceae bacterium]|nr:hydroxyphenylacetyl-CoA thioesterase PaaI [Steroidobacteraceae bacterium]